MPCWSCSRPFCRALAKRYRTLPGDVGITRLIQRGPGRISAVLMGAVSEVGWQWPSVIARRDRQRADVGRRVPHGGRVHRRHLERRPADDGDQRNGRAAPARPEISCASSYTLGENSFPSGHVVHYVTFYGFLFYIFFTHLKPGRWRTIVLNVLAILVLMIGPSRVYHGRTLAVRRGRRLSGRLALARRRNRRLPGNEVALPDEPWLALPEQARQSYRVGPD